MEAVLYIFTQDWKNWIFLYRAEIWRIVKIVVYWTASYYLLLFLLHYFSLERSNKCKICHQNSPFIFTLLIPDFSINVMHYAMWIFNRAEHRLFLNWKKMFSSVFLLLTVALPLFLWCEHDWFCKNVCITYKELVRK